MTNELQKEAIDTIRRLSTNKQRTEIISEHKETFKQQSNPLLRMFPIPEVKDTLLYYKIDLFVIPEQDDDEVETCYLKVQQRTEESVAYNYLKEESTSAGTKGFKYFKSSVRRDNVNNRPSSVVAKDMIEHPFYKEVVSVRKEIMSKYKKHDMLIKPYLSNFYEPNNKNQGTFDFCSSIVSWEKNQHPEVYIRMGDWEFHDTLQLHSEKTIKGRPQMLFSAIKTIRRDYNPKRRSL